MDFVKNFETEGTIADVRKNSLRGIREGIDCFGCCRIKTHRSYTALPWYHPQTKLAELRIVSINKSYKLYLKDETLTLLAKNKERHRPIHQGIHDLFIIVLLMLIPHLWMLRNLLLLPTFSDTPGVTLPR